MTDRLTSNIRCNSMSLPLLFSNGPRASDCVKTLSAPPVTPGRSHTASSSSQREPWMNSGGNWWNFARRTFSHLRQVVSVSITLGIYFFPLEQNLLIFWPALLQQTSRSQNDARMERQGTTCSETLLHQPSVCLQVKGTRQKATTLEKLKEKELKEKSPLNH